MPGGITRTDQEWAIVEVEKIRCDGAHYDALLTNPERDAPHDKNPWFIEPLWMGFKKSDNTQQGIPVLKKGWILKV